MRFTPTEPPRIFQVGKAKIIELRDCGRVHLEPDEQVTFVSGEGHEYDVVRKDWGYYATPSLNDRLRRFGLRAALVRSGSDRYYVYLVEEGKEQKVLDYLSVERQTLVAWIDSTERLWALEKALAAAGGDGARPCLCGKPDFALLHTYLAPPAGETRFPIPAEHYRRELHRCSTCGHMVSVHAMDPRFYEGTYVSSTYGEEGVRGNFERIRALPPEKSDNAGRVARILAHAERHLPRGAQRTVLDVGSGLCVFLDRMKQAGWACTGLDLDERLVRHARDAVGVQGIQADFRNVQGLGRFDAVTFNKVLEHVPNPVEMLAVALRHLGPHGFAYVEVPDAEMAWLDSLGPGREEFFLEHLHGFSVASLCHLATRAGFVVRELERLREPSGKYTLRAFLTPDPAMPLEQPRGA